RNEIFFSLEELSGAINERLAEFNTRPFQKRTGSRHDIFKQEEAPTLRPLPEFPYEVSEWVYGRKVNLDCHIQYKNNYEVRLESGHIKSRQIVYGKISIYGGCPLCQEAVIMTN